MTDQPHSRRFDRAAPGLRGLLRAETADLHARLDAEAAFTDLRGYGRYLRGTRRFRHAVEQGLGGDEGWRPTRLADLAAADLADLGIAEEAPDLAPGRRPDASAAWGVFYVLEGSALGARFLLGRATALGLGPEHGARHLHAQTAERGRWARFVERLDTDPGIDPEAARAGARAAFELALAAYSIRTP
ncbi:MAG: hypothetical protein DI556_17685 [Rhodovulum sulfidophilum]|uniref:Heme oxygenase n=1 Tax=Rhodovulum sulfidophilum TaxID=35806 RepID=A0A2W5N2J9_RHOSU|nr:MAG: hypothetical protein DI556_17685 [Rhodovulum sulfidophilum]